MNEYVLITGASRGIGKAIAKKLAENGYNLYLTCLHHGDELKEYCKELSQTYEVSCIPFVCDIGDYYDVAKMFDQIPLVNIVINNAGIAWLGLLTDMTPDEWDKVIRTNLSSLYNTSKCAVPIMLRLGGGRIVNISSVWGQVGASTEVAYSASKGGVNGFTRALAKELAPSNISVNAISCGVIDTDMNRSHLSEDDLEVLKNEIPAGRLGTPEEVADMTLKIITSPEYMTGQIISLDGGWI
ncbi:3-oxoacyl-[acyl-carrier protein] reductase [Butyrivibrio fibrisolvens DSM 3071]|jgi:3-oxoacyl-[acyl-carrier protein] reductase|uniref:3-oxoacyl-[acyl-carrier protein] reductase n=1 Tax=Butyrivibrio fibrisolvens DSM 3071 TaxID=1121131 RepID=A0A1M6DHG6_BUTFI|nr:SDR family NAD(P)-dependent oxidoreductase [Butyrivibrio fibrisolvens]SHI72632.1 3-oxoacyl-[acyl-carrier protein] reductase [Butyrivibrio fibrisolvens DSM 3071]